MGAEPEGENNSVSLAAITNGLSAKTGVTGPETQAQSKITDTLSAASLTQYKLMLYKRVGDELGVKEEDYATPQQYASALKDVVRQINAQKDGRAVILRIEHDLGLDQLGVSLDTVISSIDDPKAAKTLDDALKYHLAAKGEITTGGSDASLQGTVRVSEIGIYNPAAG